MDPEAAGVLFFYLIIYLVFGAVTASIAVGKGRSGVGWFFVGVFTQCIGLILILCLSNLKEEQERWDRAQREQRRLREQLKQERLKTQAFQGHVRQRLDVHDQALGTDTRELAGAEGGAQELEHAPPPLSELEERPSAASFAQRHWFAAIEGKASDALSLDGLKMLYRDGEIDGRTLVWTSGMAEWQPLMDVPGLLEEVQ